MEAIEEIRKEQEKQMKDVGKKQDTIGF